VSDSPPADSPADPAPLVFEFSVEELADILHAHVAARGLLPEGTYWMRAQAAEDHTRFRLVCTPLPNVRTLPTRKKE
jgi:hypothetical protein